MLLVEQAASGRDVRVECVLSGCFIAVQRIDMNNVEVRALRCRKAGRQPQRVRGALREVGGWRIELNMIAAPPAVSPARQNVRQKM